MKIEPQHRRGVLLGALIGALVGASAAYLLITTPADETKGKEPELLKAKDLLDLTNMATKLLRQLDMIRNKT